MSAIRRRRMLAALTCIGTAAIASAASAHVNYGGTCISCHNNTGKDPSVMTWMPTDITVNPGSTGSVSFDVTSFGVSATGTNLRGAISLQGLENAMLAASIAGGGGNWTFVSESHGTSYNSDIMTAIGMYVLNVAIGAGATPGTYPIGVSLAASGGGGSALRTGFNMTPGFSITVIPEPATLGLCLVGVTAIVLRRRKR